MNRNQFRIVIILSSITVVLVVLQIIFGRMALYEQTRLAVAGQIVNEGRSSQASARQLAARVYQVGQQTQDPGLKDLIAREQIVIVNPSGQTTQATNNDSTQPVTSPAKH